MSQVEKVYELLKSGDWVCSKAFWDSYMRSAHKRRAEAEKKYSIEIEDRPCCDGISGSRDYRIKDWKPPTVYRPISVEEAKQYALFK